MVATRRDRSYPLGPFKQAQWAEFIPRCNSSKEEGAACTDALRWLLFAQSGAPKQGGERAGGGWMLTSCFRDAICSLPKWYEVKKQLKHSMTEPDYNTPGYLSSTWRKLVAFITIQTTVKYKLKGITPWITSCTFWIWPKPLPLCKCLASLPCQE